MTTSWSHRSTYNPRNVVTYADHRRHRPGRPPTHSQGDQRHQHCPHWTKTISSVRYIVFAITRWRSYSKYDSFPLGAWHSNSNWFYSSACPWSLHLPSPRISFTVNAKLIDSVSEPTQSSGEYVSSKMSRAIDTVFRSPSPLFSFNDINVYTDTVTDLNILHLYALARDLVRESVLIGPASFLVFGVRSRDFAQLLFFLS